MSSIAVWTDQGCASLGFVSPAELYAPSRCATFERQWKCRTCGEVRFVEGSSTTRLGTRGKGGKGGGYAPPPLLSPSQHHDTGGGQGSSAVWRRTSVWPFH